MQNIKKTIKKTKVAKYFFLITGVFVLFTILITYLNKEISSFKYINKLNQLPILTKQVSLTINNPVFEARTKDSYPYKITAKTVTGHSNNIYDLSLIDANYQIPEGILGIIADTGKLDENNKKFELLANVQVTFNDLILNSEKINFDLEKKSAESNNPVKVFYQNSVIEAKNFNAHIEDKTVSFEGDVSSKFDKKIINTADDLIITSNSLKLNNNEMVASFKGLVTVLFDDIILKTDCIKVFFTQINGNRSLLKIEIPGKLTARKNLSGEIITADKGIYTLLSNELILSGNVIMNKDENIVITNKMIYITKLK